MKFVYHKLVTEEVPNNWSETHELTPSGSTNLDKRDNLFAVVSASDDKNIEKSVNVDELIFRPKSLSKEEIFSYFKSEYANSKKTSNLEVLKESLQRTKDRSLGYFEKFELAACSFFGKAVYSNFAKNHGACSMDESGGVNKLVKDKVLEYYGPRSVVVYLAATGGAKVILNRDKKLTTLIDSVEGKIVSASGFFKENDTIILGTNSFFEYLSTDTIRKSLNSKNLETAVENLNSKLHLVETKISVSALFISLIKGNQSFRAKSDSASDTQFSFVPLSSKQDSLADEDITHKSTKHEENGVVEQPKSLYKKRFRSESEKKNTFKGMNIKKGFENISGYFLGKKIFVRDTTSSYEYSKKKKVSATVGLILIVLFAVSVIFGIRQKKLSSFKNEYTELLNQAEHELQEAEEIFLISPQRSRELLNSGRAKIEELNSRNIEDERLSNLSLLLEEKQTSILGEYKLNSELFIDLSLLSSGFVGDSLMAAHGKVYVLDAQSKKLVRISIDTKRSEVVAGPGQLGEVAAVTGYADRIYILNSEGISEIDGGAKQKIERSWSGDALIYSYAGNIYVLDHDNSEILRFAGDEGDFSSGNNWLTSGVNVNLSNSKSWVIDGAIWILDKNGNISKFSLGNKTNFSVKGVFPEITGLDAIYTSEDTQFLYLLDASNNRVVVVDKDGNYNAQYVSEEIRKSKSLVVSEEEKKIILLTGEKLHSIEIKHLN